MHGAPSVPAGKRAFDLAIAIALALPAALLCLGAAVAIWFEDRANPFFVQRRLGRGGRVFRLVKLRTMRVM